MFDLLIGSITGLLKEVVPDADKRAKMAHEVATMAQKHAHEAALAQIKLNEAEAKHRSLFVAGWRPFVGWICATAFAAHFIIFPTTHIVAAYLGAIITLPEFDIGQLMTVLLGMLGLGGLRTYEKKKGLTK